MALSLDAVLSLDSTPFLQGLAKAHLSMRNAQDMIEDITRSVINMSEALLKVGFDMVDNFQRGKVVLTDFTGSAEAADEQLKKIAAFAVSTPFKFEDVMQGTRTLHGFGIAISDTIPLMQVLGDKIATLGGGSDKFTRLIDIMGKIVAQGRLTRVTLTSLTKLGIEAPNIIAKALGIETPELLSRITKGSIGAKAAVGALLNEFIGHAGAMQRIAGTLYGAMDQASEQFQTFLGSALLPVADHLVALIPLVQELGSNFSSVVPEAVDGFIQLADAVGTALSLFNAMPGWVQETAVSLVLATAATFGLVVAMTGLLFVSSAAASAAATLWGFLAPLASPVVAVGVFTVVAALGALAAGFVGVTLVAANLVYAWNHNWYGMRDTVYAVVANIKSAIGTMAGFVNEAISFMIARALKSVQTMTVGFADMFKVLAKAGGSHTPQWILDMNKGLDDSLFKLQKVIVSFETAKGTDGGFFSNLAAGASIVGNSVADAGSTAIKAMRDHFIEFTNGPLSELFSAFLPDDIEAAFKDWMSGKTDPGKEIEDNLKDWLDKFIDSLSDSSGTGTGGKAESALEKARLAAEKKWIAFFESTDDAVDKQIEKGIETIEKIKADYDKLQEAMAKATKEAVDNMSKYGQSLFSGGAGQSGLDMSNLIDSGSEFSKAISGYGSIMAKSGGEFANLGVLLSGLGGPIGILIGAVIEIITKTKTFQDVLAELGGLIDIITEELNKVIRPIQKFYNVWYALLGELITIFIRFSPAMIILRQVANLIGYVGAAIVPIMEQLQAAIEMLSGISSSQRFINQLLSGVGHTLFEVMKVFASIVLIFAFTISSAWDAMVSAIISVVDLIGKIPGMRKLADNIIDSLDSTLSDQGNLWDDLDSLWSATWEDANATAEHTTSVKDGTKAMDKMTASLLNVPVGYKVALARLNAAIGSDSLVQYGSGDGTTDSSGGNSGQGSSILDLGGGPNKGAGNRSRNSGAGIVIEGDVYVSGVTDMDTLYTEITKKATRAGVIKTGTPIVKGSRFSTT